jgi:hypothetical protein
MGIPTWRLASHKMQDQNCVSTATAEFCRNICVRSEIKEKPRKPTRRLIFVRFEVFTAVTMKNGVFWDVTPISSG